MFNRSQITYFVVWLVVLLMATPVLAVVMSSTNYAIERDTINFSGGLSTSSSYVSESSMEAIEGGLATSTAYILNGGYQQMDQTSISLSVPGSTAMSGAITTSAGGMATAAADISVLTNNSTGYTLQIKSNSSPAMVSGVNSFADYATSSPLDYSWAVNANSSSFGYTPEGADLVDFFKDDGSANCNQLGGTDTLGACWSGLYTDYVTIAQSTASNLPTATITTINFKAEAGASASPAVGTYTATVIFTAFVN